jgi:hypothetical protein
MFKETLEYLAVKKDIKVSPKPIWDNISIPSKYKGLKPEVRNISEYSSALKEDKGQWKN